MKIVTVIGARPQFVKAAAISRVFRDYPQLTETIIHTGQHFDSNMSDIFFEELDIPKPNYNLGIGGGTHGENTGRMIEKIEEVLLKEQPDLQHLSPQRNCMYPWLMLKLAFVVLI